MEKLNIIIDNSDKEKLKQNTIVKTNDIIGSRDLQFVAFLIFLSFESMQNLIQANILSDSASGGEKDVAKLISELVQRGALALNNLKELRVANGDYRGRIEKILCCPEWTAAAGYRLELKTEDTSPSSKPTLDDIIEKDSPQKSNKGQSLDKNWTDPIGMHITSSPNSSQPHLASSTCK